MNNMIFPEDVANVVQSFCMCNDGDEATISLVLAIGAELLDISQEEMSGMCGITVTDGHCTESYTAFVYEDDGTTTADMATYGNKDDAVSFAKSRNWDEVVNDITGDVVWNKVKGMG